jgi:hypothetical protein
MLQPLQVWTDQPPKRFATCAIASAVCGGACNPPSYLQNCTSKPDVREAVDEPWILTHEAQNDYENARR